MEKKISASILVDELATRCKLPQTVSEEFVRTFFETIIDGLQKDKIVKVKGLGTFKLSEVSDRESVDVNSGERIVIKGFRRVTFTPETAVKERINRPFAHFETVELENSCHFDDMTETIDAKEDDTAEDSAMDIEEYVESIDETPVDATPAERQLPEITEQRSEPEISKTPVVSFESDVKLEENPIIEETATAGKSTEVIQPDTKTVEETIENEPEVPESIEAVKAEPSAVSVKEKRMEESQSVDDVDEEIEEISQQTTEAEEPASIAESKVGEDFVYYTERRSNKSFWRYWLPALVLVIAACCLYIYVSLDRKDFRFVTYRPSENDMIMVQPIVFDDDTNKNVTDMAAQSTQIVVADKSNPTVSESKEKQKVVETISKLKSETKSEVIPEPNLTAINNGSIKNEGKPYILQLTEADKAKNLKDITVADTTEYIIDGTLVTHELQKDETIIRLALKYYGDKRLWPYIVKYNWLKNPDSLPVGTALNIPFLKNK
jgi:nucleoid DNA-binding protein